jgi:hypothetical protein
VPKDAAIGVPPRRDRAGTTLEALTPQEGFTMNRARLPMLALLLLAAVAPTVASAAAARHSGRVLAVDPGAGTVRIEEMVAWTGPNTGAVERTIRLTPDTTVQVVRRAATVDPARWPNAFEEQRITADSLKPGDFVTATTGSGDLAVALEVVQPDN